MIFLRKNICVQDDMIAFIAFIYMRYNMIKVIYHDMIYQDNCWLTLGPTSERGMSSSTPATPDTCKYLSSKVQFKTSFILFIQTLHCCKYKAWLLYLTIQLIETLRTVCVSLEQSQENRRRTIWTHLEAETVLPDWNPW